MRSEGTMSAIPQRNPPTFYLQRTAGNSRGSFDLTSGLDMTVRLNIAHYQPFLRPQIDKMVADNPNSSSQRKENLCCLHWPLYTCHPRSRSGMAQTVFQLISCLVCSYSRSRSSQIEASTLPRSFSHLFTLPMSRCRFVRNLE